mgnify:CR=1 FL=1
MNIVCIGGGPAGLYFNKKLEEAGLVNLAYWENGFRNLSNSVRPVTKWEDFEGMKVRVMQNDIFLDTFSSLGTNAMPMAFGEVFTALETGTIDAQENPFANTVTYGVHHFHKFHSATNHFYLSRPIFVHRPSIDGWPRPIQEEFRAAVAEAAQEFVQGRSGRHSLRRQLALGVVHCGHCAGASGCGDGGFRPGLASVPQGPTVGAAPDVGRFRPGRIDLPY